MFFTVGEILVYLCVRDPKGVEQRSQHDILSRYLPGSGLHFDGDVDSMAFVSLEPGFEVLDVFLPAGARTALVLTNTSSCWIGSHG